MIPMKQSNNHQCRHRFIIDLKHKLKKNPARKTVNSNPGVAGAALDFSLTTFQMVALLPSYPRAQKPIPLRFSELA